MEVRFNLLKMILFPHTHTQKPYTLPPINMVDKQMLPSEENIAIGNILAQKPFPRTHQPQIRTLCLLLGVRMVQLSPSNKTLDTEKGQLTKSCHQLSPL
jgi:hypothetical protein